MISVISIPTYKSPPQEAILKMKTLILFLFVTLLNSNCIAQEYICDSINVNNMVRNFIYSVKQHDTNKIATIISFPFSREYPIPAIKNRKELGRRYKEVFDDSLVKLISNSSPEDDWRPVGWRGIMLLNGVVWLDYDGRLITINYQSALESKMRQNIIATEKSKLHESIRKYKEPVHILKTKKYRIRIDELENGKYRYVSWIKNKKITDNPDLVINNGEVEFDGSGGNHHYTFTNDGYTYICRIVILSDGNEPDAYLHILKGKKEILKQGADIVRL